jgi:hypothetical protein
MGTLCENCPLKNIHNETGEDCTVAFVRHYGNSCVNYDIAEHVSNEKKEKLQQFEKDIADYQEKKKSAPKKPKTTKKNNNGNRRSRKKDSILVQEVCEAV